MNRQVAINLILTAITAVTVQFGATQKANAQKVTNEFTLDCIQKFQQGLFPSGGKVTECQGIWNSYEHVLRKRIANNYLNIIKKELEGKQASNTEIERYNQILAEIRKLDIHMLLIAAKNFDDKVSNGENAFDAFLTVKADVYNIMPQFQTGTLHEIRIISAAFDFALENYIKANSIHAK